MNTRLIVSAVIEKDGKILLGRKEKDRGPYPNTWHIPGGGVELDKESLEEAITREIKEETGLEVENLEKLAFDEDFANNKHGELTHYVFLVFKCSCKSGEPKPSDDLVELEWFNREQLQELPLTKPSTRLFKELGYI